ncbi:hypothetical protein HK099_007676 [Clydaea vesicula]|uniref:Selenoprotein O n=1 Tax=Clydaea vesicula TaxID=447962 RepID=A0AAD5XTK8_9FUNG|nr:hypothetical protein HK099_007676 [Clydaea vesicula]
MFNLNFTSKLTSTLIPDAATPTTANNFSILQRMVKDAHFSYVKCETFPNPKLISVSENCLKEILGCNERTIENIKADSKTKEEFVKYFTGEIPLYEKQNPWALAYAGHQFGSYAGQLGDGRAISLAQFYDPNGKIQELQLKGAGLTPYSRFADGYAVLRSSIREYLCSEAMYHLNIPTSRALCLIGTDKIVYRETPETGAVVCRVAPSWIRFGSFELPFYRKEVKLLKILADYTIENFFSKLANHEKKYEPDYICNHSDEAGVYSFENQPNAAYFNMAKFATALVPLVLEEEGNDKQKTGNVLTEILQSFVNEMKEKHLLEMHKKLGFSTKTEESMELVKLLLVALPPAKVDYTIFFRELSEFKTKCNTDEELVLPPTIFIEKAKESNVGSSKDNLKLLKDWFKSYNNYLIKENMNDEARHLRMKSVNPKYILRNNLVQDCITLAEKGNYSLLEKYFKVLQKPFDEGTAEDYQLFGGLVPNEKRRIRCSCSS